MIPRILALGALSIVLVAGCSTSVAPKTDTKRSDANLPDGAASDGVGQNSSDSRVDRAQEDLRRWCDAGECPGSCGECAPGSACARSWSDAWQCLNVAEECLAFCEYTYAECGEIPLRWESDNPLCDCGTCAPDQTCNEKHRCCPLSCDGRNCGETCDGLSCGKCELCEVCADGTCILPETGSFCQTVACVSDDLYCEENTGSFGCECETDEDCWYVCLSVFDGKVCSREGAEECPMGWSMKGVNRGPDMLFMCVPNVGALCWPCDDDDDCNSGLGWGTCVDRGSLGSFCATDCDCTYQCHIGFACYVSEDSRWGEGFCQPDSPEKECHCSPTAAEEELSTTCYVENEFGTCFGSRHCTEEGLTPCDAKEPEAEICNDLDDDCNGIVDDVEGCGE